MEVYPPLEKNDGLVFRTEFEEALRKKFPIGNSSRFCMNLPESKSYADLNFSVDQKKTLGAKEVEVSLRATGLNFKDFIAITKPKGVFSDTESIGLEFSGTISDLGSEVINFKIGDKVFGLSGGACGLASHIVVDEQLLTNKPDTITHVEAAALPVAFCASIYSLGKLADVTGSDTVLIHGATGGVGLSAIQICKILGAKLVTTAGSRRKRAYLRSLGIEHVFDSRSTSYGEQIIAAVGGVDVVLNSLTGQNFKEKTLSICNKNARFIDLGTVNNLEEEYMRSLRPDVSYRNLEFKEMNSEIIRNMLCTVTNYINGGFYTPLPVVQFDGEQCQEAFEYFQKTNHIGKVVLSMPNNICVEGALTKKCKFNMNRIADQS